MTSTTELAESGQIFKADKLGRVQVAAERREALLDEFVHWRITDGNYPVFVLAKLSRHGQNPVIMPWMFAIILAAVLWYFGDFVAALAGFAFGWILGFVIRFFMRREREQIERKRRGKRGPNVRTVSQPPTKRAGARRERQPVRPPKKEDPLQWFGPSERIKTNGYTIVAPMLYCTNGRLPWPGEPSAIDPSLPVGRPARGDAAQLGYYSSFERMTPGQRGAYLEWLAMGRRDENPGDRDLGYLFLFFYGLERRILLVRDLDHRLRQEIMDLLDHYGPSTRSRSLRTYFLELLHFSSYLEGTEVYRQVWPKWLTAHGAKLDGEVVKLVLANLFERGEPMHWTVAWHLAPRLEKSRKSVVVTRSGEKFWKLFQQRYEEAYPEGIELLAAKRPVWVEYRAASSSLLALASQLNRDLRIRIPNVMGFHSQFNKLADIWNSCIDDLSGFSRALAHQSASPDEKALAAFLKLPPEIRNPLDHPLAPDWSGLLKDCETEDQFSFVPTASLASLFGLKQRDRLTAAQSRQLAEHVDALGYSLAPDPRVTGIPLMWDQELVVYPAKRSFQEPAAELIGILRMLYLTVSVAAADGAVDPEEVAVFEKMALQAIQDDSAKEALEATGAALLRDTGVADKALTRIAKGVSEGRRELVARYAIQVAAADEIITPDEARVLKRIFKLFDLPSNYLESQISTSEEDFGEVTVQKAGKAKRKGEAIPKELKPEHSFQLDMSKIAAITAETSEVIGVLSSIMDDDEEEDVGQEEESIASAEEATVSDAPSWMEGLEDRYQAALSEILQHGEITRDQLSEIAKKHHAMPVDLVDTINAWADESLGDFLIEDEGDRFVLYLDLVPEENE